MSDPTDREIVQPAKDLNAEIDRLLNRTPNRTLKLIENTDPHPVRFQAVCGRCGWHWPKGGYVTEEMARLVYSRHDCSMHDCNCTQDGQPYCGDPECDIDFCTDCGEDYTDPCPRHENVSRP